MSESVYNSLKYVVAELFSVTVHITAGVPVVFCTLSTRLVDPDYLMLAFIICTSVFTVLSCAV